MFKGDTWRRHREGFERFIRTQVYQALPRVVLDYGCGPTGGIAGGSSKHFDNVFSFDPYVRQYSADPWYRDFNIFFSCDVFEHLPLPDLHRLMTRIRAKESLTHLYIALSTRPANKTLPNGLNVHLTVKPAEWWQGFLEGGLGEDFKSTASVAYLQEGEATFEFVRVSSPKSEIQEGPNNRESVN